MWRRRRESQTASTQSQALSTETIALTLPDGKVIEHLSVSSGGSSPGGTGYVVVTAAAVAAGDRPTLNRRLSFDVLRALEHGHAGRRRSCSRINLHAMTALARASLSFA
jgi:hypothetical protein